MSSKNGVEATTLDTAADQQTRVVRVARELERVYSGTEPYDQFGRGRGSREE